MLCLLFEPFFLFVRRFSLGGRLLTGLQPLFFGSFLLEAITLFFCFCLLDFSEAIQLSLLRGKSALGESLLLCILPHLLLMFGFLGGCSLFLLLDSLPLHFGCLELLVWDALFER